MLIPLHGFAPGDTLGVLVLVQSDDTVAGLAASLAEAVAVRRTFVGELRVRKGGSILQSHLTVAAAGLTALDRVDLVIGGTSDIRGGPTGCGTLDR